LHEKPTAGDAGLYLACIVLSGLAMVADHADHPSGVFMRYVMNDPLQWPEPASVIMMVFFSFIGGAAVYRANQQIAVEALMNAVGRAAARRWNGACTPACCWSRVHARLRRAPVRGHLGQHHRRVPVAVGRRRLHADPDRRLLTLLFIVEKMWLGEPPQGRRHVQRPGRRSSR
jgi:hypothetical protein